MTVIGLDDTDSRERGMCTTFVAASLAFSFQRSYWARVLQRRREMRAALEQAKGAG